MAESSVDDIEAGWSPKKQKMKLDGENDASIHDCSFNFSTFELKQVLNVNATRKVIFILGTFAGHDNPAIVILEKKNFPQDDIFLKRGFFNEGTILRKLYRNDVYGNYECFPTREHNGLKMIIIHPASQKHIDKFMRKELYIVEETFEIYQNVTLPYIESSQFSLQWVENIFDGKAEADRIIFNDKDEETGFIMLPDLKWDKDPETLHILVIAKKKLKSLRELNESHLPILKNIRDTGLKVIKEKFNIPSSKLRIYMHYQPSYYQMHVHFVNLMYETPGIYAEKAHLLSTVINNIELMSNYYQKVILSYVVSEIDPLCKKLQEAGVLSVEETTDKTVEEKESNDN